MLAISDNADDNCKRGKLIAMPIIRESQKEKHERIVRFSRLAMLIECEGSITIGMTPPSKTRNRPALYPTVDITNTCPLIIGEAIETIRSVGADCTERPVHYGRGFGRKMRYDINVHGFERISKVMGAVLPYLKSKRHQGEILVEFVESRRQAAPKSAYSEHEWQLVFEVRKLNGRMPERRAIDKALAYLALPEIERKPRTTEYFQKYVSMCADLTSCLVAA